MKWSGKIPLKNVNVTALRQAQRAEPIDELVESVESVAAEVTGGSILEISVIF